MSAADMVNQSKELLVFQISLAEEALDAVLPLVSEAESCSGTLS
jgi:hypothetical protein